jgi:plastocyanin
VRTPISAGALFVAIAGVAPAGATTAPRTATIIVDKLAFGSVPANLRVGDSILWVNRDVFLHSATSGGHFDIDLPPGAERKMRLTKAGRFAFICKYHPGMKGTLSVR